MARQAKTTMINMCVIDSGRVAPRCGGGLGGLHWSTDGRRGYAVLLRSIALQRRPEIHVFKRYLPFQRLAYIKR